MEDFTSIFVAAEEPYNPSESEIRLLLSRTQYRWASEYFPWKTEEELCNYRLKPLGITFEEAATKIRHCSAEWTT
jgi:hypothetical protein